MEHKIAYRLKSIIVLASLGYLRFKFNEFKKPESSFATKEDALLLSLTKKLIDELEVHIESSRGKPKKMKLYIDIINDANIMCDASSINAYLFAIYLLEEYTNDKENILGFDKEFLDITCDINDIVCKKIDKTSMEKNLEKSCNFYKTIKRMMLNKGSNK